MAAQPPLPTALPPGTFALSQHVSHVLLTLPLGSAGHTSPGWGSEEQGDSQGPQHPRDSACLSVCSARPREVRATGGPLLWACAPRETRLPCPLRARGNTSPPSASPSR